MTRLVSLSGGVGISGDAVSFPFHAILLKLIVVICISFLRIIESLENLMTFSVVKLSILKATLLRLVKMAVGRGVVL